MDTVKSLYKLKKAPKGLDGDAIHLHIEWINGKIVNKIHKVNKKLFKLKKYNKCNM